MLRSNSRSEARNSRNSGGDWSTLMNVPSCEYDVFISYRVASDEMLASSIHDKLLLAGLRVWFDKSCLAGGVAWEQVRTAPFPTLLLGWLTSLVVAVGRMLIALRCH